MKNPGVKEPTTRIPRARLITARIARLALAALIISTASSACSRNNKEDEGLEPQPPTYLKVENRAFLDMNLYIIHSSQRIRIGQVTGNSTGKLLIPANLLNATTTLQFQASPIGGNRSPISQQISVSPGDEIFLIIPPN
jgi:hypothetical protein